MKRIRKEEGPCEEGPREKRAKNFTIKELHAAVVAKLNRTEGDSAFITNDGQLEIQGECFDIVGNVDTIGANSVTVWLSSNSGKFIIKVMRTTDDGTYRFVQEVTAQSFAAAEGFAPEVISHGWAHNLTGLNLPVNHSNEMLFILMRRMPMDLQEWYYHLVTLVRERTVDIEEVTDALEACKNLVRTLYRSLLSIGISIEDMSARNIVVELHPGTTSRPGFSVSRVYAIDFDGVKDDATVTAHDMDERVNAIFKMMGVDCPLPNISYVV